MKGLVSSSPPWLKAMKTPHLLHTQWALAVATDRDV